MDRTGRSVVRRRTIANRVWEARPTAAADGIPVSDALFIVGAIATAFAAVTVATAWLVRDSEAADRATDVLEVSLGEFRFGTTNTARPRMLEFEAVAVVAGSPGVQSEHENKLRTHAARVSAAVEEAGRAATDAELDEPDLSSFRGRIRGRVNHALGTTAIDDVLIDDFRSF